MIDLSMESGGCKENNIMIVTVRRVRSCYTWG